MEKENSSSDRSVKIILGILFGIILASAVGLVLFIVFSGRKTKEDLVLTVTTLWWSGFSEEEPKPKVTEYENLKEGMALYDDTSEVNYTDENGNDVTELRPLFGVITLDEVKEDHVLLKITDSRFYSQWTLAESLEIKMGEAVELKAGMMDMELTLTIKLE